MHVKVCMERRDAKIIIIKKGATIQREGQETVQLFIRGDAKQTLPYSTTSNLVYI